MSDNLDGVVKDFGCGIYGFIPSASFNGSVYLRCMVEGIPIRVKCRLSHQTNITIPEQFSRTHAQRPTFSYSILSDNSVFISKQQLTDALGIVPSANNVLRIISISTNSLGYVVKQTDQYCVVFQENPQSSRPQRCSLDVTVLDVTQQTARKQTLMIDGALFSSVIPQWFLSSSLSNQYTFEQQQLLENTGQLSSPILLVDALYSTATQAIYSPKPNGSFDIDYGSLGDKHKELLFYNISDAVAVVGLGVVKPLRDAWDNRLAQKEKMKWCAIELNQSDLLHVISQPDIAGTISTIQFDYSDMVAMKRQSSHLLRLTTSDNSRGIEKVSIYPDDSCGTAGLSSFELIFMPNLVYENCVTNKTDNHWQVSRREIEQLVSQRTRKRIQHVGVSCRQAFITANDLNLCSLWTAESKEQMMLNLTLSFDDGTVGFSSITI
ncbi:hypothetical protein [Vibrio cionasavignyae]|uniref:hypothetical protein n=1 Tax=Vibrio cionasavignyae TaxID=2910252 RepID=UPI003D0B78AB